MSEANETESVEAFGRALIEESRRRLVVESYGRIKKCLSLLKEDEMWHRPNIPMDEQLEKTAAIQAMTDPAAREAATQAMIKRKEFTSQRLFLGKNRDDSTLLSLNDIQGRPRIRMSVSADGTAKLEFLDAAGQVLLSIPE